MPLPNSRDEQVVTAGLYTKPIYTYATLPSVSVNQGRVLWLSDLSTNPASTSGQVAAGGGTTLGRVVSDGTNWRVYGWTP